MTEKQKLLGIMNEYLLYSEEITDEERRAEFLKRSMEKSIKYIEENI